VFSICQNNLNEFSHTQLDGKNNLQKKIKIFEVKALTDETFLKKIALTVSFYSVSFPAAIN
jgi:hypothetical protein